LAEIINAQCTQLLRDVCPSVAIRYSVKIAKGIGEMLSLPEN